MFMVLVQSAATAASHAIDEKVAVQRVDYPRLRERLLADGQILEWTGPKRSAAPAGIVSKSLPGIVIDDDEAELQGFTELGRAIGPFVGAGYRHDGNQDKKGRQTARYNFKVEKSGQYEVRIGYPANPNRATNVPIVIRHAGGETSAEVNQKNVPKIDRLFEPLGRFEFMQGQEYAVIISNERTDGYVVIDAVQIVPLEG
jgi:hypothetical protein